VAITELYSRSVSPDGTERSLVSGTASLETITTDGVYQLYIDLSGMTYGDSYEIKIYETVTSGALKSICYKAVLTGPQAEPLWVSPSFLLTGGWDFTIIRLSGASTATPSSIRQIA